MWWFYRERPPSAQPPTGIHQDDDFRPSPPRDGIIERFAGYWRGIPVYRERAPKATFLRDPRAVANEKRRAARGAADASDNFLDDGPLPYRWDGRGQPD
jgi:hypothetical protein